MKYNLRNWEEKDMNNLAKYANNEKIALFLRNAFPYPYTLDDAKFYIEDSIKNENNDRVINKAIVTENDVCIGGIGIFLKDDVYSKSAEIGYWLAEEFWGKGIMSDAVAKIIKLAFNNTDIVRIEAGIFAPNIGSAKVLEANGFKLEGKLKDSIYKNGEIMDSLLYAMTRKDYEKRS